MKIIICGAGRITDELLKRIGENWEITLIEKEAAKLDPFPGRFPSVVRLMAEDASSPVVLEKAGLAEQDCVLAMTDDDPVNLAIARFARAADINNILAVVRDPEMLPEFQKLDIWTLSLASDTARKIYQFLKDPRIRILSLGEGDAELMELTVSSQNLSRLQDMASQRDPEWRVAGVLRNNTLLFPDHPSDIEEDDRLLILGKSGLYAVFSDRLEEDRPHFPRTYGQQMILAVNDGTSCDATDLLNEAFYLAQGTQIEQIKAVHEKSASDIREALSRWSESLRIEVLEAEDGLNKSVTSIAHGTDAGIVVLQYVGGSFLQSIFGNRLVKMRQELPCPVLMAKFTNPYERLLIPFDGSQSSRRALEIGMDLSRQLHSIISVVTVVEPPYLHGRSSSDGEWERYILNQVRELSRVHNTRVEEYVRHGNPVKEILAIACDYQLLVIGSGEKETGLFSIDVTDILADKAPCSVLLV